MYIESDYYCHTGKIEKCIPSWELYRQTYPRDPLPWDNLCNSYAGLAQFEKSVSYCQEEVRLDPSSANAWQDLAQQYRALNRFDEAKAAIESAIQRGQHSWALPAELIRLNVAQGLLEKKIFASSLVELRPRRGNVDIGTRNRQPARWISGRFGCACCHRRSPGRVGSGKTVSRAAIGTGYINDFV